MQPSPGKGGCSTPACSTAQQLAERNHHLAPSPTAQHAPPRTNRPPTRRAPLDNEYLIGLVLQHRHHLIIATVCLLLCTASNLAAPVLSGLLFETLVQQQPMERYAKVFCILLAGYVLEPVLTQVYMYNIIALGEKVGAALSVSCWGGEGGRLRGRRPSRWQRAADLGAEGSSSSSSAAVQQYVGAKTAAAVEH
jgi:hypothetical protein